jgi:integrase
MAGFFLVTSPQKFPHGFPHGQQCKGWLVAYIRKLKNGWRAEVQRGGQRASKVLPSKREAQAWALEQEAQAGALQAGWRTFAEAADRYEREVSARKRGAVWERRRLAVLVAHFGARPLGSLDAPDMAAWRDARLARVSPSTVVREANLLKHLLHTARDEWRWVNHDPFRGVKLPSEAAPRHQRWRWQQIRRVLRAGQQAGPKTREAVAAFHIALRTGMRLQEALAAPAGFDAARRVVTLATTKTTGRVQIPVGRIAARLLTRPAFTVGANEASTLFAKLCRQLLIDGLTFHDSRATALTLLAKRVDVLTLAKISRHKNLSLLMNTYYRESAEEIAARL